MIATNKYRGAALVVEVLRSLCGGRRGGAGAWSVAAT